MADIDIRQTTRERLEMREYVTETLKGLIDWIHSTKPSEYLPPAETKGGGAPLIQETEVRQRWQDWIEKSSNLMDGAWKLPILIRDDAIAIMEDIIAKPKGAPEAKP